MTAVLSAMLAAVSLAAQLALDVDAAVVVALLSAFTAAYSSARLLRANRRRILDEASNAASEAADRMLARYENDNRRLRERVVQLETREDELEQEVAGCYDKIRDLEREVQEQRDRRVRERETLLRRIESLEDDDAA